MTILQEIQKWSENLPSWQQDAIVRLFSKGVLDAADYDDLYAILKSAHGINDPKGRVATKLAAGQVAADQPVNSIVQLAAIKNLRHVNALAEKQTLSFQPNGLTVIYGDNGSGKSGYSRALKRACRARDQSESILPNAKLAPNQVGKPEAEFDLIIDGQSVEAKWVDGTPAHDALSSIAIFDARCARAYLDDVGDFAYVPYGLDILEELAKVCIKLKAMLDEEVRRSAVNVTVYAHLANTTTAVGKLITRLSANTKPADIEALGNLSDDDLAKRLEIEASLKEGNPKDKAQQLMLRSGRFAKLAERCSEKLALINADELNKLRELIDASKKARSTADLAANQFKQTPGQLPETGGAAWQELFEAARKFSIESHVGEKFPHLSPESQCPLCQQPLGVAAERLVAFDSFIQQEAEKSARDKKAKAIEAFNAIVKCDIAIGMDVELRADIAAIDEKLAKACDDFQSNLLMRRDATKKASGDGNWDAVGAEPASPASKLSMLATKLAEDAATLLKAADDKARATLESGLNELNDRLALFKAKAAVLDAITKFAFVAKLKSCESDVRTNAITIKSNELNEQVVSKNLADALNAEFKLLGVDELHVDINTKVVKGKANHKLVLKLPGAKLPKDILSEGEQRAIAIASFLAEVNIGQGLGGVVFDDPVSSLDHRRRELVAERIVEEAKKRQVVVFTHDVYFLCILQQDAENAAVPFMPLSLHRKPEGFGVADPSLPFEGSKTSARIGTLRQMQTECAKLHKIGDEPGYRKQARDTYFHLRLAWERAVEEVLFRNVVIRFREGVETNRLIETTVETSDFLAVDSGMTKCSKYAHDKAALGNIAIPGPDDVLQDINKLEAWRALLETRSKETRKARSS